MSAKIMGMIFDLDVAHLEWDVLLALADHADHNGENAYPSVALLAYKVNCSKRKVQRALAAMRAKGWIDGVQNDKNKPQNYTIRINKIPKKPPFESYWISPEAKEELRSYLKEKHNLICAYCLRAGSFNIGPDGKTWEIDRVIPGRHYTVENTALSCSTCNKRKKNSAKMAPHAKMAPVPNRADGGCQIEQGGGVIAVAPKPSYLNHPLNHPKDKLASSASPRIFDSPKFQNAVKKQIMKAKGMSEGEYLRHFDATSFKATQTAAGKVWVEADAPAWVKARLKEVAAQVIAGERT